MNDYETARERFRQARLDYPRARRRAQQVVAGAIAECEAAEDALAALETEPGVPLPQYRSMTGSGSRC